MIFKAWRQFGLSCLISVSCIPAAWSHPEVFSDLPLEEAKQQAQKSGKLLLLDFMATWCPPCRKMESTTWVDPDVKSWLGENALAVQIDVDKNEKAARAFGVNAMPTLIIVKPDGDGKEFGRQLGYLSADELLGWLKSIKSGKSAERVEQEMSHENDADVFSRLSNARQLMLCGKTSKALDGYIWLWNNLSGGSAEYSEIRCKVLPVELKQLFLKDPAAKERFVGIRDAAEKDNKRADWIILNTMIGDEARTLAWFDKAKADPSKSAELISLGSLLEYPLFANCRWQDAAKYLYPRPLEKVKELYKAAEALKKPRPDTEVAADFDPFPTMIPLVYGAYVGAGLDAEAKAIADECLRLDDTAAMHQVLDNMKKSMEASRVKH